jgi:hypothetical protein
VFSNVIPNFLLMLDECKMSTQYTGFDVLIRVAILYVFLCVMSCILTNDTSVFEEYDAFSSGQKRNNVESTFPGNIGTHLPHYVLLHSS